MQYRIQIDGLRFIAVTCVLIGHWIAWEAYNPVIKYSPWGHGVILFFVISGFLITNILLGQKEEIEEKKTTIGKALKVFYIRRFFRIFPIYYLLIFYLYYINYPNARSLFPWLVSYTSNIYQSITNEYVGNFNHFWSLAVEEQFYIFWPFLIFLIPKKYILRFFLATLVISFISRLACHLYYPEKWMLGGYFTPNLLFPLVIGAILAWLKRTKIVFFYNFFKPMYAFASLAIYAVLYYFLVYKTQNEFFKGVLDEYVFSIVSAFFIATAATDGFTGITSFVLTNRFSNHIGKISYGVYLLHLFIPTFFFDVFTKYTHLYTDHKKTAWVFYFILCFSAATLSYHLIEKPVNLLKNKFKY